MAEQGHGGNNAHHGLADEGEDGKEKDGLGSQVQCVDLVMRMVMRASFSALFNGLSLGVFQYTRGIRQVHPISPYYY